jgi:hypothetical protein
MSLPVDDCTGLVADFEQADFCSNGPDTNKLGSVMYADAQVSWKPEAFMTGARHREEAAGPAVGAGIFLGL